MNNTGDNDIVATGQSHAAVELHVVTIWKTDVRIKFKLWNDDLGAYETHKFKRVVMMDNSWTDFGDSGGGWSVWYKAWGSHIGSFHTDNASGVYGLQSVFSPVTYFDEGLGIKVKLAN